MKTFLLLLIGLGWVVEMEAQNLVPNGSFEKYYSCPWSNGQVDTCKRWYGMGGVGNPLPGTPDYFNACAGPVVNVPDNTTGGYQYSFEGVAHMGLLTYTWNSFWREIIGTQLLDTLVIGNTYHVSMRVSRGNHTPQANNNAASNNLGLLFSKKQYTVNDPPPVVNFAHVYVDSVIRDTLNWVLLQWDYVADSAYTYAYIGNFFDDAHTDILTYGAYPADAYYFIDSVNLYCVGENCITAIDNLPHQSHFNLSPNPTTSLLTITNPSGIQHLTITNSIGQIVFFSANFSAQKNISVDVSSFPAVVYFVQLKDEREVWVKEVVVEH